MTQFIVLKNVIYKSMLPKRCFSHLLSGKGRYPALQSNMN